MHHYRVCGYVCYEALKNMPSQSFKVNLGTIIFPPIKSGEGGLNPLFIGVFNINLSQ